jgi:hypothetical protein
MARREGAAVRVIEIAGGLAHDVAGNSTGIGTRAAGLARRPHLTTVAATRGGSVCGITEGRAMPTGRGSALFSDLVELHGDALLDGLALVERITGDGIVEPSEEQLLKAVIVELRQTYAPLPAGAAEQDNAFRAIGAIAGAGRVSTKHVKAVLREAGTDAERLRKTA